MPAPFRFPPSATAVLVAALLATVAGCGHLPARSAQSGAPSAPSPATAAANGGSPAAAPATHWYWPFHRRKAPAPEPVEELVIRAAPGSAADFLQFWERNTLVVDMRSASGTGGAVLAPREHTLWPVRLAFRVAPGSIGQLEVKGVARTVFPVATSGSASVDLQLGPDAYAPRTPTLTLAWGPAPIPAAP